MARIIFTVLVALVILAIALTGAHILVERLFVLVALVILSSFLFARFAARGLKGEIKHPDTHHIAGRDIKVQASIKNHSIFPRAFFKLKLETGHSAGNNHLAISLPADKISDWSGLVKYPHRGVYRLGPLVVETTDIFGIMHLKRTLDAGHQIVVCPHTVELPEFEIEAGPVKNRLLSQEIGAFSGIREYVPGDSLSRIHWRSTAHMGKLIVKEFDVDVSERIWVILDLNREFNAGKDFDTVEETAITTAASILKKYIDTGRQVGLIAQDDVYRYFPARGGHIHMWNIMEALGFLKLSGQTALPRVIFRAREHLSGNSIAVVITASDRSDVAESLVSTHKQGIRTVAVFLDSASFGGTTTCVNNYRRMFDFNIPAYLVRQGKDLSAELSIHHQAFRMSSTGTNN